MFFKNIVFEKLESQFTIIKYADIVNWLASLNILELRVFHSKNSIVIFYTAILGGDVAACRPSCSSTF